jgi:uncharacterized protein YcbX
VGTSTARLTEITYYPVKGCAGTTLTEAALTPTGLPHDRAYAIADEKGELRWQGGDPRMALISPESSDGEVTLRAPGRDPVRAPLGIRYRWLDSTIYRSCSGTPVVKPLSCVLEPIARRVPFGL